MAVMGRRETVPRRWWPVVSTKVTDPSTRSNTDTSPGPPTARVPKADPTVWPWLSKAMANTTRDGTDGTDQFFGIPSASQDWGGQAGVDDRPGTGTHQPVNGVRVGVGEGVVFSQWARWLAVQHAVSPWQLVIAVRSVCSAVRVLAGS